jgi:NTE family protein
MTGATNEKPANRTEIGLVLQGGGALGAYEYGGILALFDLMDQAESAGKKVVLRVVTGVSIGAINAACIVGAGERDDARRRLGALWDDFTIQAPAFMPEAITSNFAFFEVPHFYRFSPGWNWTYLYRTAELLETLNNRVNFAALNESDTAFVVTAVDVTGGKLTSFANQPVGQIARTTIEPQHVLASGSLAPQFPWTQIGEGTDAHYYWDGGLVDNTPLGAAIDAFTSDAGITPILVVMNLFPLRAKLPNSFVQVDDRVNQLRFGNRLSQDARNAKRVNALLETIEALLPHAPPALRATAQAQLDRFTKVRTVEVALSDDGTYAEPTAFRDFSRQGIENRRRKGYETTHGKLVSELSNIFA